VWTLWWLWWDRDGCWRAVLARGSKPFFRSPCTSGPKSQSILGPGGACGPRAPRGLLLLVQEHQRQLPRQSDCGNLLLKVGWEMGVVLRGPPGGDVDVVPAEAENCVPPGWGEGVPLAEESVGFFGELDLIILEGCGTTLQEELDDLGVAFLACTVQWCVH
jgi:hypothetical protein